MKILKIISVFIILVLILASCAPDGSQTDEADSTCADIYETYDSDIGDNTDPPKRKGVYDDIGDGEYGVGFDF